MELLYILLASTMGWGHTFFVVLNSVLFTSAMIFVGIDIESFVYFPLGLQNISCLWLVLWVMSISAWDRLAVFGWRYIAFLSHLLLMSCISRRSLHFWWRVNYPRWWTFFPPSWVVHAWPFIPGRTYDVLLQMHDMSWSPKVEYALACYLATWQNGV